MCTICSERIHHSINAKLGKNVLFYLHIYLLLSVAFQIDSKYCEKVIT